LSENWLQPEFVQVLTVLGC